MGNNKNDSYFAHLKSISGLEVPTVKAVDKVNICYLLFRAQNCNLRVNYATNLKIL